MEIINYTDLRDIHKILYTIENSANFLLITKLIKENKMRKFTLPVFVLLLLFIKSASAQQPGVAINTNGNAAHSSALLDVQSTNKGFLLPRITQAQRLAISNPANGLLVFDTDVNKLYQYQGGLWRMILDNSFWTESATRKWIYNTNDSIGMGTISPSEKLHVVGNIKTTGRLDADGVVEGSGISSTGNLFVNGSSLLQGAVTGNSTAHFSGNINSNSSISINDASGILQFKNGDVNKGFFQISGDDVRLGTNSGNATGNVYIRMNGANRFQFTETGRMTILADQSPTLYFNTDNTNKAYLQLQGESIKLDAPGNKVYVGDDLIVDDATNRVGIGTSAPEQKLHVTGSAKITGGKVLNNANENLLPLGYAAFDVNGNKVGGTSNMSGGWIGTMFKLNCTSDMTNAAIIITVRNAKLMSSWDPSDVGTSVYVSFFDADGDERGPVPFSVVIYKAN